MLLELQVMIADAYVHEHENSVFKCSAKSRNITEARALQKEGFRNQEKAITSAPHAIDALQMTIAFPSAM